MSPLRARELIALLRHPALRPDDLLELVYPPDAPPSRLTVGSYLAFCEEISITEEGQDRFWFGPEHELTATLISDDGSKTDLKMSESLP